MILEIRYGNSHSIIYTYLVGQLLLIAPQWRFMAAQFDKD